MKKTIFKPAFLIAAFLIAMTSCSSSDEKEEEEEIVVDTPVLTVAPITLNFGEVVNGQLSVAKTFTVTASHLTQAVTLTVTEGFVISADNAGFSASIEIPAASFVNGTAKTFYAKFSPTTVGAKTGTITVTSPEVPQKQINLSGTGTPVIHNYQTFNSQRLAFNGGFQQASVQYFNLHNDLTNIEKINMYINLRCPTGGCNAWDVYANVQVRDVASGEWYEIGRYITPYGKNNAQVDRGFEIDVTDFKSLLQGNVEMRAYIEVWGSDGWLLSVDFDYIEGTPDYQYYAISRLIQYNANSLEGVIYGEDASAFDLTKSAQIPANAQATSLRTIITGWGHATPNDVGGRPCAEWCFRTHDVKINGANTFSHYMGPIGCASNPVQPQGGNWNQDRAGWCPGMAVPVRVDNFTNAMAGQSFNFEYTFQPWTNDLQGQADNIHAYYAISSFVVVKSNTPIAKPIVTE